MIGWPLQWYVCRVHFIDLPFRHLFQYTDGKSTGRPLVFVSISKQLPACETLSVDKFLLINGNIPIATIKNLNDFSKGEKITF